LSPPRFWGNNNSVGSWKVLWVQQPDEYAGALCAHPNSDDGSPSYVGDRYDDYDVEGLYTFVTYQKGQDNSFGRCNERRARALKCSRRLREIEGIPL
jgi:hypothetical protein